MKRPGKMIGEVLSTACKKPATTEYPFKKAVLPKNYRGHIKFISEKCIGCKMCVRDCPASAIRINKIGDKKFEAEFDLDKCIYCAQCVDSCLKNALETSKEFELAQLDSHQLKVVFHASTPADPQKPTA